MWGDFVYNAKTKSVSPWTSASKEPPIFVKMVLSAVWRVYKSIYKRNDDALRSILDTIGVSLTPREWKIADPAVLVKTVMERWLPLYRAVLSFHVSTFSRAEAVVKILPSPVDAQKARFECIWEPITQKRRTLRPEFPSSARHARHAQPL